MAIHNDFRDELLGLVFTNVAVDNVGGGPGLPVTATEGNWHVSLHTVALAETGNDQTQDECAYTGPYARVAVPRNITDWTVTAGTCDNDNAITFPTATSSETAVEFGLGFATSGAGDLKMSGDTPDLSISNGITPEFAAGALDITLA